MGFVFLLENMSIVESLMLMTYFNPILPGIDFIFFPSQYVAYAEGLIRAYNIQSYAIHYTLQREMISYTLLSC